MPGTAQPDAMPWLKFNLYNVLCNEIGGLAPCGIINSGNSFQLTVELGLEGILAALVGNKNYFVNHHVQDLQTGTIKVLSGGNHVTPTGSALNSFTVPSPTFTTGATGSGADVEIPAGYVNGTFRVLTHIHFTDPTVQAIVTAFHDGLVIMIE